MDVLDNFARIVARQIFSQIRLWRFKSVAPYSLSGQQVKSPQGMARDELTGSFIYE